MNGQAKASAGEQIVASPDHPGDQKPEFVDRDGDGKMCSPEVISPYVIAAGISPDSKKEEDYSVATWFNQTVPQTVQGVATQITLKK